MRISLLLALLFTLSACAEEPQGSAEVLDPAAAEATDLTPVEGYMEDGVQVVEVTAGPTGYSPAAIKLQPGVPTRLVFTRTVEGDCSSQVQIPDLGVPPTDLPMNEPVAVTFTPTEGGTFTFICGMQMQRGTLLVQS